jgi:predicted anti-sigma-YlaC factor YlaD
LGAGLTAERIYSYLDGEMEGAEASALEQHLAACAACREAVAARRRITEAAESLPSFEVPDGFAEAVMARVKWPLHPSAPARARRTWRAAAAAAVAGLALTGGAAWVLISGRSLSDVLLEASRFLWGNIRGLATLAAKSWSYGTLAVKVLGKLAGQVLEGFKVLSSFIGPEVQIACLGAALVLAAGGFALWRRKFGVEKNHDES